MNDPSCTPAGPSKKPQNPMGWAMKNTARTLVTLGDAVCQGKLQFFRPCIGIGKQSVPRALLTISCQVHGCKAACWASTNNNGMSPVRRR